MAGTDAEVGGPRLRQRPDVGLRDLGERGETVVLYVTAVRRPVVARIGGALRRRERRRRRDGEGGPLRDQRGGAYSAKNADTDKTCDYPPNSTTHDRTLLPPVRRHQHNFARILHPQGDATRPLPGPYLTKHFARRRGGTARARGRRSGPRKAAYLLPILAPGASQGPRAQSSVGRVVRELGEDVAQPLDLGDLMELAAAAVVVVVVFDDLLRAAVGVVGGVDRRGRADVVEQPDRE